MPKSYSTDPRSVYSRLYDRQRRVAMMGCEPDTCYLCGASIAYDTGELPPVIEHKIPLKRGGTWDRGNLEWACLPCNSAKNNSTLDEYLDRVWHLYHVLNRTTPRLHRICTLHTARYIRAIFAE
jgi:5-methylcytosine-specific restriction endonuclease McrA